MEGGGVLYGACEFFTPQLVGKVRQLVCPKIILDHICVYIYIYIYIYLCASQCLSTRIGGT